MEAKNELERVAQSKTTEMIAAILKGEAVSAPENPTVVDKTEQDILRAVGETYREILNPKKEE